MKVSFIGAGNVGTAFGLYIKDHYDLTYYYSRTMASAMKAANKVGCQPSYDLSQLVQVSDMIFITTGDSQIDQVVTSLSHLDLNLSGKTFVHMSGAMTSDILSPLRDLGARTASMHPLQTFPNPDKGFENLGQAYFALEGDVEVLLPLVGVLGNSYFILDKDQKSKYHMAACIFSNYLVTLMAFGSQMLKDIGIDERAGLEAMMPLVHATLGNLVKLGPERALTGPIQRGDIQTLKAHMKTIEGLDLNLYKTLMAWTSDNLINDPNQQEMLKALWRQDD